MMSAVSALPVDIKERNTCRLCNKTRLKSVFELPATPLANHFETGPTKLPVYPLIVMLCSNCLHVQLKHVVNPKVLFSHYKYASGTSPVFVEHFSRYAIDEYTRWCEPGSKPFVVECGSNDGTALQQFKALGCRVIGVEPALNLCDIALKQDVPTVNTFFDYNTAWNIFESHGPAKLIVANNVLAHIDELGDVVRAVNKLLDPKGVLIFEVQYVGDLLAKGHVDNIYHEHVSYHALAPLLKFIKTQTLWVVLRVERVPTHGGSIRVTVGNPCLRTAENDATVEKLLHEEQVAAVNGSSVWALLQAKVIRAKLKLRRQLETIYDLDPDETIVGYGAPAKATTLMYAFGLKATDIDYIVDDSPLKQGLYTPGLNIPVKSPDVLLVEKPRYVLVLAWNFAESIIAKWKPLLPNTVFIVPFEGA